MPKKVFWFLVLALTMTLGNGCGSQAVPDKEPDPPPPQPSTVRLDDPIPLSLRDLLARPRQELAALANQLAEQIQFQEKKHRDGLMPFVLLPDYRPIRAVPVFSEARFSARARVSLPPYLKEGQKDNEIARHLAGFGDVEGALRIADRADWAALKQIESCRFERNYPVEWTRLVALHLDAAHIRLATGDLLAARELVGLHKQLREVLDAKARSGSLGAILLPRGRPALTLAAAAWRKANETGLADQAEAAVAAWGSVPEFHPLFVPERKQTELARLLASSSEGLALKVANLPRAFDLLALPFPQEGTEAVIAGFNGAGQFAELVVVYVPGVTEHFSRPEQLAQLVEERGSIGQDLPETGGLHRRAYKSGDVALEVTLIPNHTSVGALVRVTPTRGRAFQGAPTLGRAFGVVDLDQSFEQNRVRFALQQRGPRVSAVDSSILDQVANPLKTLKLTRAEIVGDREQTLVNQITFTYGSASQALPPFGQTMFPLWAAFGPCRFEGGADKNGRFLALHWNDSQTQYTLRLANGQGSFPVFRAQDRTPSEDLDRRVAQVRLADRKARRARFKADKLLTRIARVREKVALGMSRSEVDDVLPRPRRIIKRSIPGGMGIIFKEVPEDSPGYIPREMFVRFGPDEKVAEIRVRYLDDRRGRDIAGLDGLLEEIKGTCGAPQELPSPWAQVWTKEYAARSPDPVRYRWQDDTTMLTWQQDSEGIELALLDCPLKHELGVPLPAFECLPRGPENCELGDKKAALLKKWKDGRPRFQQGWLVLSPPEDSPFDQFLVRFNARGRVIQINARHRDKWEGEPSSGQLAQAVEKSWLSKVRLYGWPRREDHNSRKQLKSWSNHDDRTRLCIFWQEGKSGVFRVFTEWTPLDLDK
jgi:hypothetical protein